MPSAGDHSRSTRPRHACRPLPLSSRCAVQEAGPHLAPGFLQIVEAEVAFQVGEDATGAAPLLGSHWRAATGRSVGADPTKGWVRRAAARCFLDALAQPGGEGALG